ncbi:DUF4124 domain-containing protein [Pinirhizobacter sp.]|jgi:hypothetical protein|uniref:DUF4124 domain-containing protein n=1 Tax=Pinirhizobacter sp. TaxID=2950432 RepID=UPI002F4041BF
MGRWRVLFLLGLGLSGMAVAAHADIYRCNRNGQVSYQQVPCEAGSTNGRLQGESAPSPLLGCYEVASQPGIRLTRRSEDDYVMTGGGTAATRMRPATADERKEVGQAYHLVVAEGVVMQDDAGDISHGIYHGQNAEREDVFFAHLPFATGLITKRTTCDSSTP